ncbi:MAG: hypothetical protein M3Z36_11270 [Acidobacteriota bacterium]|nr:hypothetical protein [Acidobacteriota bacterium]
MIALILTTHIGIMPAAAPSIGVALGNGNVTVDNTRTPGNAPIFEGNTIETAKASSRLQLQNGANVQLASDSRGKVYSNHLILEKGTTQFKTSKGFEVDALSLKISGNDSNSTARVSVRGPVVQVASVHGNVRVVNGKGVLVANLMAGRALEFTPQDNPAGSSSMTGCLSKSGNTFMLTDETSNVAAELRGSGLDAHVGHRITVTGAMLASGTPAAGASQVVNVSDVKMLSTGCSTAPMGAGAGSGGAAGAGAAAGMGANHATTIIAGIVIAAAVGTTVGVIATSGETVSPSRP